MKIGYGTRPQEGTLRTAGAVRVFFHPDDLAMLMDHAGVTLRAEDTLIMVQPKLITIDDTRLLLDACGGRLLLQVVGHEAQEIGADIALTEWRKLRADVPQSEVAQLTGRPKTVAYTMEQADAIVRAWHAVPKNPPREVTATAERILGLEAGTLKAHWVRDLVIKFVGTAQRERPADWNGIQIKDARL